MITDHSYASKKNGLYALLSYAQTHAHSQFWIRAITLLLQRQEVSRG
jgi:hypothetical protein